MRTKNWGPKVQCSLSQGAQHSHCYLQRYSRFGSSLRMKGKHRSMRTMEVKKKNIEWISLLYQCNTINNLLCQRCNFLIVSFKVSMIIFFGSHSLVVRDVRHWNAQVWWDSLYWIVHASEIAQPGKTEQHSVLCPVGCMWKAVAWSHSLPYTLLHSCSENAWKSLTFSELEWGHQHLGHLVYIFTTSFMLECTVSRQIKYTRFFLRTLKTWSVWRIW